MEAGAAGARPNYQLQYTLEGHRRAVAAVKFSPDGDHIASASELRAHRDWFGWLSPAGVRTHTGADKTLRVWSVEGRCVVTCSDPASKGISDVAWSADSQYLCSAGDDMLVTVWDVRHVRRAALRACGGRRLTCVVRGAGQGGETTQGAQQLCDVCQLQSQFEPHRKWLVR